MELYFCFTHVVADHVDDDVDPALVRGSNEVLQVAQAPKVRGDGAVVARRKAPFSAEASTNEPLNLAWPRGVISLSHVALPFAPDDPLYGQDPPGKEDLLFLGQMAIQGERDLLKIPYSFLVRLRHNPFYAYLETRVLEWFVKPH